VIASRRRLLIFGIVALGVGGLLLCLDPLQRTECFTSVGYDPKLHDVSTRAIEERFFKLSDELDAVAVQGVEQYGLMERCASAGERGKGPASLYTIKAEFVKGGRVSVVYVILHFVQTSKGKLVRENRLGLLWYDDHGVEGFVDMLSRVISSAEYPNLVIVPELSELESKVGDFEEAALAR
jgi:hypothetical protein